MTWTIAISVASQNEPNGTYGDFTVLGTCQNDDERDYVTDEALRNCAGIRSDVDVDVVLETDTESVHESLTGIDMLATELPTSAASAESSLLVIDAVMARVGDETWRITPRLDVAFKSVWVSAHVKDTSDYRVKLQALPTSFEAGM